MSRSFTEILSNFLYDISLPLRKNEERYTKFLTPKLSLRYSPNETKNIQTLDRQLNIDNVFNVNRIGTNDDIEGGASIAFGNEFLIKNREDTDIFSFDIATVYREEENKNLPSNNTLRNSQSDIAIDTCLCRTPRVLFEVEPYWITERMTSCMDLSLSELR